MYVLPVVATHLNTSNRSALDAYCEVPCLRSRPSRDASCTLQSMLRPRRDDDLTTPLLHHSPLLAHDPLAKTIIGDARTLEPRRGVSVACLSRRPCKPSGGGKDRRAVIRCVGVSNRTRVVPARGHDQRNRKHEQRHRGNQRFPGAVPRESGVAGHDGRGREEEGRGPR